MASPNNEKRILDYYSSFDEWSRLDSPSGQFEFERTIEILENELSPESKILDLGGGPGRYTLYLAESGREVCLADLSPKLVEEAKRRVVEAQVSDKVLSINVCNATNLVHYADQEFDYVLCLGPFYHLTDSSDRNKACQEISRVLRPGGKLLSLFIPRLSGVIALIDRASYSKGQVVARNFLETVETGSFHNEATTGFQSGFYAEPEALQAEFENAGFHTEKILSIRGIAYGQEKNLQDLAQRSPSLYQATMQALRETASRPEIISMCGHALYIGRK